MHIGRAQIGVVGVTAAPVVVMRVRVRIAVMVIVVEQEPGAGEIDQQADRGERGRLGEIDRHRRKQPPHRLVADQHRDQRQQQRAGKGRQFSHFAGAEGKARIARVPAREAIGERGDAQRAGMGRHVPAVGDHRHGAEQRAADDLRHHHDGGQRHHEPDAPLVPVVPGAEEQVGMLPGFHRLGMHEPSRCCGPLPAAFDKG